MADDLSHIAEPLRRLAIPVSEFHLDPANARLHPERNLEAIKSSLARFGQRKPIVVRRDGMVIEAGNGTLEAARALGWTHLAAVIVDDDATTATGFSLADNRSGELAEWDDAALGQLLGGLRLDGFEVDVLGWTDEELDALLAGEPPATGASVALQDDVPPEPAAVAVSKRGDLWFLGDHRLLCGDSTKAEDVQRLMNGERAVLFAVVLDSST